MKNQIEKTLPRSEWQKITISENNEPLVEMKETSRLKINVIHKNDGVFYFVRKTIAEKLSRVSLSLPEGVKLVLIEGYRSMESQQKDWDFSFQKIKKDNPNLTDEQIEQKVGLVVAKPLPLANHHCGGAVDVTLAYSDGTLLDMGTPYLDKDIDISFYHKFKMLSDEITDEQKENRKILRDAMESEDFVWYPNEWWHYCWGDRMWAVYSNQNECFYGPIDI